MELLTGGSDEGYDYSMAVPDTISTGSRMGRAGSTRGSLATVDRRPEVAARSAAVQRSSTVYRARIFPTGWSTDSRRGFC